MEQVITAVQQVTRPVHLFWKTIWLWLDGKKTIILFGFGTMINEAVGEGLLPDSSWIRWVSRCLLVFGGVTAYDHAKSGKFKKCK